MRWSSPVKTPRLGSRVADLRISRPTRFASTLRPKHLFDQIRRDSIHLCRDSVQISRDSVYIHPNSVQIYDLTISFVLFRSNSARLLAVCEARCKACPLHLRRDSSPIVSFSNYYCIFFAFSFVKAPTSLRSVFLNLIEAHAQLFVRFDLPLALWPLSQWKMIMFLDPLAQY